MLLHVWRGKQTPYIEKKFYETRQNSIYKKEKNIQLNNLIDYILVLCITV